MLGPTLDDIWLGQGLALGGSGLMAIGGVLGSTFFTVRHKAYERAGFSPDGNMGAAWTLSALSVVCFGTAMGFGIPADLDHVGLMIAAVSTAGIGCILEVVNLMAVRRKWDEKLMRSAAYADQVAGIEAMPMVFIDIDPVEHRATPLVGAIGSF
ncbi:MAG: hypothetical protein R6V85_17790 [Polyangia bacterium]